jgi:hypothetical protein
VGFFDVLLGLQKVLGKQFLKVCNSEHHQAETTLDFPCKVLICGSSGMANNEAMLWVPV